MAARPQDVGNGEPHEEKHPIFVFIAVTQMQRRESLNNSLWLTLFRPFFIVERER